MLSLQDDLICRELELVAHGGGISMNECMNGIYIKFVFCRQMRYYGFGYILTS